MIRLIFFHILLIALPILVNAQFDARVNLDRYQIDVGSPIAGTLKITCPKNKQFESFSLAEVEKIFTVENNYARQDSNGNFTKPDAEINWKRFKTSPKTTVLKYDDFEWIEKGNVLETIEKFEALFWDAGRFKIPGGKFYVEDSLLTQRCPISNTIVVNDPFVSKDELTKTPPNDIKSILLEEKIWSDYILMYVLLALALLICFLLFRTKQTKNANKPSTQYLNPTQKAINQLDQLEKTHPWKTQKIKPYHSELSKIVREFIKHHFGIPALESSSKQIIAQLSKRNTPALPLRKVNEILQITDAVKFAKLIPDPEKQITYLQSTRNIIISLSQMMDEEE